MILTILTRTDLGSDLCTPTTHVNNPPQWSVHWIAVHIDCTSPFIIYKPVYRSVSSHDDP